MRRDKGDFICIKGFGSFLEVLEGNDKKEIG